MKKYLYVGLFAAVCAVLISIFVLNKMDKITPVELNRAIPRDALLVVENVDVAHLSEEFLSKNRLWIDLLNTSGYTHFDSTLQALLLKLAGQETLHELLLKNGLSVSLHRIGKDQLSPLLYMPYAEEVSDDDFEKLMWDFLGANALANKRKYEGEFLNEVSGDPNTVKGKFTFACVNGICLLSPTSMLVEESIRSIHSSADGEADQDLQAIRRTAGKYVHANIYLNYALIGDLLKTFVKEDQWSVLGELENLARWGELDLDLKKDALVMNGLTIPGKDEERYLGMLLGQDPVKMELHERIPSGSAYFIHLGISDKEAFRSRYGAYLQQQGRLGETREATSALHERYGLDPVEDLLQVLDDEVVRFALEGVSEGPEDEVLMYETKSRSETVDVVMRWIEQYLQVQTFEMDAFRSVYRLDAQTSFNIYKMPPFYGDDQLAKGIFSDYFTVYENCLIFGPSVEVLSQVLYKNVLHKTFVNDAAFQEMSPYFSTRSNLSLFIRPFAALEYREELFNAPSLKRKTETELFLRRLPGLVIQYSSEGDMLYQSISIRYAAQIKEKALTVWESMLDSSVVIKPALVTNHTTREKEIFVQDAGHRVYLVNSTGRILWSMKLEGKLMGDVHQVDYYKNGKLQYLFNTPSKIHLIDRNGNYVERYPIALRQQATAPLALFDYDKSRNYRIFVPVADRRIYAYDIDGSIISGWKFGKSESRVETPLQHFRIGDKDYIVFSDQSRAYFLDRRGRERVKPRSRVVFSRNNGFALDMNLRQDRPRWISTDTLGNVICVYTDGSVSRILERNSHADHFFQLQDMTKDGVPEFIIAEGNELKVIGQDGKPHFSYKVKGEITMMPDVYKFSSSDLKIGITDQSRNRIYLINGDGSLYEGFPLEGSTRFSIGYFAGSDSRFNLIVGSSNNFLFNYSIE